MGPPEIRSRLDQSGLCKTGIISPLSILYLFGMTFCLLFRDLQKYKYSVKCAEEGVFKGTGQRLKLRKPPSFFVPENRCLFCILFVHFTTLKFVYSVYGL